MVKSTLIVVGPGGVGKGPLGKLIRDDAITIDPYRLRPDGPRQDSDDALYAPPKLRAELHQVLSSLGDSPREIPCEPERMEWFARAKVLFFTVRRNEWQCLILNNLDGDIAKAELYAPVLPAILGIAEIRDAIGTPRVLVLNPVSKRIVKMPNWAELEAKTEENCKLRGDPESSVQKRKNSVGLEAPAWRALIAEQDAIELTNWPFPEYRFKKEDESQLLRNARRFILRVAPDLEGFFKSEDEL